MGVGMAIIIDVYSSSLPPDVTAFMHCYGKLNLLTGHHMFYMLSVSRHNTLVLSVSRHNTLVKTNLRSSEYSHIVSAAPSGPGHPARPLVDNPPFPVPMPDAPDQLLQQVSNVLQSYTPTCDLWIYFHLNLANFSHFFSE